MKKRNLAALLMAGAMCFSLLAGCSGGDQNSNESNQGTQESQSAGDGNQGGGTSGGTFKLGGIGPLTGGAAIYGQNAMNGVQIAVDEINALGGDIQFEFRPEDDQHNGELSVNAYNTLKDWGMQILVGTVTTGPALSVSPLAYQDHIFMLTPSASSTDVVDGKDNVFQVCFTDPNQGFRSAEYIDENMDVKNIAIIYKNDDAYSTGIYQSFLNEANTRGMNIVSTTTFTEDTQSDFSVQVAAARDAGADLVYLPMYYTPASVIMTQANQIGYEPIFFGVDGMDGILSVEGFDTSLAEGVMLLSPFAADATDDLTVSFVTEYEKRYGDTPNQFAADAYDAVYILYEAIKAAGVSADMSNEEINSALVSAITTITVSGLTGEAMTWASDGTVSKDPRAVVIKDGLYATP